MATATLTITDIDLDAGQVQIEANVTDSKTDDGFMTAAEVMLRVLHAEINSPAFERRVWEEVAKMTAGLEDVQIGNDNMNPLQKAVTS